MFGVRTRLVLAVATTSLALSGCSSAGTKAGGAASPKLATTTSTQQATSAPNASQKLASNNAPGDVKFGAIRVDKLGKPSAAVTITNHSSKRSNYIVDVSITSADGKTKFDAAMVSAPGLAPGQTTKKSAIFKTTQKLPKDAKLTIVGVARLGA